MYKLAAQLWEAGVTPGAVIRTLGPWGPGLVDRYVAGRFNSHGQALEPHEAAAVQ